MVNFARTWRVARRGRQATGRPGDTCVGLGRPSLASLLLQRSMRAQDGATCGFVGTPFAPVAGFRAWTAMARAKHLLGASHGLWTIVGSIVRHHQTHTLSDVSNLEFANAFAGTRSPADNYASRPLLCRMVLCLSSNDAFSYFGLSLFIVVLGSALPLPDSAPPMPLSRRLAFSYRAACTVLNSRFPGFGVEPCSTCLSHSRMHYLEKRSIPLDVSIPYLSRYLM